MTPCLACGADSLDIVDDLGEVPILVGAVLADQESALSAPKGRLELACCAQCAHVQNLAFDPSLIDYDASYDNTLKFSPTFERYAHAVAHRLVRDYSLDGSTVMEIGSGRGDFLAMICEAGAGSGLGYDPTYSGPSPHPAVRLIPEYYIAGEVTGFDLLVARHVVEHLEEPASLMETFAKAAAFAGSVIYVEVPAAEFVFGPSGLWDCIYPHVSYFNAVSLRRLAQRSGFAASTINASFEGQFLSLEARLEDGESTSTPEVEMQEDVARHRALVRSFGDRRRSTVEQWHERVLGGGYVLWGAGAKGTTFLNDVDQARLVTSVDINPRKWGTFVPGTGHRVSAPSELAGRRFDGVIVLNPAYQDEIAEQLTQLDVEAEVIAV